MKRCLSIPILLILIALTIYFLTGCIKDPAGPVLLEHGYFTDTVVNVESLNSQYDDYNLDIQAFKGSSQVIFSSNRNSQGGQFDIIQAAMGFQFTRADGLFSFTAGITTDEFLARLLSKANTPGNDFGPYRFFSSKDGYEYMVLASVNSSQNLDFYYLRNRPQSGSSLPEVEGPTPVSLLNSSSNDAYFCLDLEQDSAYFSSDKGGNFDIYVQKRPSESDMKLWFAQSYAASSKADSINSTGDDKCPMVYKKIMVFASNRSGGLGGYDLYYSIFRKGKWSSPVNMGPRINSSYDEYRPVIGYHPDFTNNFLMFSSNRPGGKGGFDLYFTGTTFK